MPTKKLKRYLLFGGDNYYPSGGADDLLGDYETVDLANEDAGNNDSIDWFHVLDIETGEIVSDSEKEKPISPQSREDPLSDA